MASDLVGDYLIYMHNGHLVRREVDGKGVSKVPLKKFMVDLHIIDNWVYFIKISKAEGGIYRMSINGENIERLSSDETTDIAVYDSRIYYS